MPPTSAHSVQFYESDDYLASTVAEYLAEGLHAGEPAIVIATEPHRQAIASRLQTQHVQFLDARETLAACMSGAMPDPARFREVVGSRIAAQGGSTRAFGEMVALLWEDGRSEAALRLEELWNELAADLTFSLLCAYPARAIENGDSFDAICRVHTHADEQHGELARLRRRVAALESVVTETERVRDEFLSLVSHELRTPLTVILGWAHMLSLGELDAAATRYAIEMIERSARAQAGLIDDILDLSRIVSGKLALQTELVDVREVLHTAIDMTRSSAESKGLAVTSETPAQPVMVAGDATRLQQIFRHLLSNAVKFTDHGGISVHTAIEPDSVRIAIRDTGRGISPSFLPHLFEPFRQADGSSTRARGGLGLGLAIVRHLTEQHGGTVTVSSDGIGNGATFRITLPPAR